MSRSACRSLPADIMVTPARPKTARRRLEQNASVDFKGYMERLETSAGPIAGGSTP